MSRKRLTLRELVVQMQTDLAAHHNVPLELVQHSNIGINASTYAGAIHGLEGFLDFIALQSFEDTATGEYLKRRGVIRGFLPKPSTVATGNCRFTSIDGVTIATDTLMQRDDGVHFITTQPATAASGEIVVEVKCLKEGEIGNTPTALLTLVTTILGVDPVSTSGVISGGADEEDEEDYRQRLLEYIRSPNAGGADHDYVRWVKSTDGVPVDKVWVPELWNGIGTVTCFFTVDRVDILPTSNDITRVKNQIERFRPVGLKSIYVHIPLLHPVNIIIQNLTPDTAEVRTAIENELKALFIRNAELENGTGTGIIRVSHIREAVSLAFGESDHLLVSPIADIQPLQGELASYGGVVWQ